MYIFIINSLAGDGKPLAAWLKIESLLLKQKIQYRSINSHSKVATEAFIIQQLKAYKVKAVVVIGGDGTTNSVIQQLANTSTPIAVFPAGSGNDTARMFGLTHDPKQFIQKLLKGKTKSIDLLKLNDRYGITIAGVGIDSAIGHRANHSFYKPLLNKVGLGTLVYVIAASLTAMTFKSFNSKMTIDGEEQILTDTWLIACGNTTSYGGGLTICPQAKSDDGLLNMTIFHDLKRAKAILRIFPTLLRGKPIHKHGISYQVGKEFIIETDRVIPAVIDGETVTSAPYHITVHEQALHLLVTT